MELERVKHEWIPDIQVIFAFGGRLGQEKTKNGAKTEFLGVENFWLLHVETALAGHAVSNGPIVASLLR